MAERVAGEFRVWGCPDGGTCHHRCDRACFRVVTCEPLSGVFPRNQWPENVAAYHNDNAHFDDDTGLVTGD